MASTTWDGQDQHMSSGVDDDFNQFLEMSGMPNMPDNMQFDFQAFANGNGQQGDAMMGGQDVSNMIPRSDSMAQQQQQQTAMTTAQSHPPMTATHMMTSNGNGGQNESISNIDAQIQYLQQQKFHEQQRQIHQQQQAAFFTNPNVPPTPQSLEMAPGSGQFYSPAETRGRYHRNGDQGDVSCHRNALRKRCERPPRQRSAARSNPRTPYTLPSSVTNLCALLDGLHAPRLARRHPAGSPFQHGKRFHGARLVL